MEADVVCNVLHVGDPAEPLLCRLRQVSVEHGFLKIFFETNLGCTDAEPAGGRGREGSLFVTYPVRIYSGSVGLQNARECAAMLEARQSKVCGVAGCPSGIGLACSPIGSACFGTTFEIAATLRPPVVSGLLVVLCWEKII